MRRVVSWVLAAALALTSASCLSPTLPLPPPEPPDAVFTATAGTWTIAGACTPGAIVTVFNETRGEGLVVEDRDDSGRYVVTLPARKCDSAWVSEQVGVEVSSPTSFVIDDKGAGSPTGGACQR